MKHSHHRIALLLLMSLPSAVLACGRDDDYIGTICMTAARQCPPGTLEADGRILPVEANNSLAQVIGNAYGGQVNVDSRGRMSGTVGLPDLRSRSPAGLGTGSGLQTVYQGGITGRDEMIVTEENLPPHTHSFDPVGSGKINVTLKASTGPGQTDTASSTSKYLAVPQQIMDGLNTPASLMLWSSSLTNPVEVGGVDASATLSAGAIGKTGGGKPMNTRSPIIGVRFCIVTNGTFPPSN